MKCQEYGPHYAPHLDLCTLADFAPALVLLVATVLVLCFAASVPNKNRQ